MGNGSCGGNVVIQFPGLRPDELNAFHEGFKHYCYLESPTSIPIAVWVFDFPEPHGEIDSSFNAKVVSPDSGENCHLFRK